MGIVRRILCFLMLAVISAASFGDQEPRGPLGWGDLEAGPYAVGFESRMVHDPSRFYEGPIYDPGTPGSPSGARPIQLSVWFPAVPETGSPLAYGDYVLLEDRSRALSDWTAEEKKGFLEGSRRRLARSLSEDQIDALLVTSTVSSVGAKAVPGPFPLLIFSPGMLTLPTTNSGMCEFLASHGYVVASHPSVGVSPRRMTTDALGIDHQARDIEFLLGFLKQRKEVHKGPVGLLAHSWGAVASVLVSTRRSDVAAVLSLDGSEEEWHDLFQEFPSFRVAGGIPAPYLRLTKSTTYFDTPSQYGFFDGLHLADKYRLHVLLEGFDHFDFVSRGPLLRSAGGQGGEEKDLAFLFLGRYGLAFFDAYLGNDAKARAFLGRSLMENGVPEGMFRLDVQRVEGSLLAGGEFVQAVIEDGVAAAVKRREEGRSFLGEDALIHTAQLLLWTGRHADRVVDLLRLVLQRNEDSARAHEVLGVTYHWFLNEPEKAITHMKKARELAPENQRVVGYLKTFGAFSPKG